MPRPLVPPQKLFDCYNLNSCLRILYKRWSPILTFIIMKLRTFLSFLAVSGGLLARHGAARAAAPFVALEDARVALDKSSMLVVDIREPSEHATGVAKGAVLMPIDQISKRIGELPAPNTKPFLVICNTQNRSSRIVEQLQSMGYTNASYVKGGMSQWAQRGWPLVKPSNCYPKASC